MSVFFRNEIAQMYPAGKVGRATSHATNYPAHYQILQNKSVDAIVPKKLTAERVQLLLRADPDHHGLTPLMIACIVDRLDVVEALCNNQSQKAAINAKDDYGWTALHHATLFSDRIFKHLRSCGADTNSKTAMGGTVADIRALISRDSKTDGGPSIFYQDGQNRVPIGNVDIQSKFGMKEFRTVCYCPPEQALELWQQRPEDVNAYGQIWGLSRHQKQASSLTVAQSDRAGFELLAGEKLAQGTVVCDYVGELGFREQELTNDFIDNFSPEMVLKQQYLFGDKNAREMGNAARFANCGWPNLIVDSVVHQGIKKQLMIVADSKGVNAGQPLMYSYGGHAKELAYGVQALLGREDMHTFFRQNLEQLLRNTYILLNGARGACTNPRENHPYPKEYLDYLLFKDRLFFPLNFPAALLDLHFSGVVSVANWERVIDREMTAGRTSSIFIEWISQYPDQYRNMRWLMKFIGDYENGLKGKPFKTEAKNWILSSIGVRSSMDILKGMQEIMKQEGKDWDQVQRHVEESLRDYDWKKDQEALFSFEGRYQIFKEMFKGVPKIMLPATLGKVLRIYAGNKETTKMTWRYISELARPVITVLGGIFVSAVAYNLMYREE